MCPDVASTCRYVIHKYVPFSHHPTASELRLEQSLAAVNNPTCANNLHPWTRPACTEAGQVCKTAQGPGTYTHWRLNKGNNACLRRLGYSDKRKRYKVQCEAAHDSTRGDHQEIEDLEGCEGVFEAFPRYSSLHKGKRLLFGSQKRKKCSTFLGK